MKLILHAGTHKTGTTSVQRALSGNFFWLQERGFLYPELTDGKSCHNQFARRIATAAKGSVEASRDELMRATDSRYVTILSAEQFSARILSHGRRHWHGFDQPDYWDRKQEFLARVRRVLRDFDEITFHICFRPHDEYAASLYTTNLTSHKIDWSFQEFLERCAPIFDYKRQLESFRSAFDEVRVISFNDLRKDLSKNFFAWTGIPLPPGADHHTKSAPDARLIGWLYERMSADTSQAAKKARRKFLKSKEAWGCLPAKANASFWQSSAQRAAFLAKCSDPSPAFFPAKDRDEPQGNALDQATLRKLDDLFPAWLESGTASMMLRFFSSRLMSRLTASAKGAFGASMKRSK